MESIVCAAPSRLMLPEERFPSIEKLPSFVNGNTFTYSAFYFIVSEWLSG